MTLVDSPSFESPEADFDPIHGHNHKSPDDNQSDNSRFRQILTILVVFALLLTLLNVFISNGQFGSVSGIVVDIDGNAVRAEIFVLGYDKFEFTDNSGQFLLKDIPIGEYDLVISYNGIIQSAIVNIPFGGEADIGIIVFDTSLEDG